MKRLQKALLTALFLVTAAGCGAPAVDEMPVAPSGESSDVEQAASLGEGSFLYTRETFGGNGRVCATCHGLRTGTLSPAEIATFSSSHKIFQPMDSDDGVGTVYTKLKNDATVNVTITLPLNVRIANSTKRTVTLRRGIPTTMDAAALDTVFMWDGREQTLQHQAVSAVVGHAAGRAPTPSEQDSIALFEKNMLFTTGAMKEYATAGAPPPPLPAANSASSERGKAFFAPTGLCGGCHGGVLLNEMTPFNPPGLPAGTRFGSAGVSEANLAGNPLIPFIVTNPATGVETPVDSPDPGLMLVTGDPAHANAFKMTSLRNLKNTAPYFHDNSAKTLEAAMFQYKLLFGALGIPLSDQDITDITAYLYLL